MPAIITHDIFGQDVYQELATLIGDAAGARDAFLLGNQGPDPLFYSVLYPSFRAYTHLGSLMHSNKPSELLCAFKEALPFLNDDERPLGRAYVLGFTCHYVLDRAVHPLVYFHEYTLCDSGAPGLDRSHCSEVHALIESEFDEMVLFTKQHRTIAGFDPHNEVLQGSNALLATVSKLYVYVALTVYGLAIRPDLFASSVKAFRFIEGFFCSPSGAKRAVLGRIEELFRPYSFVRAMSPRNHETTVSAFGNHANEPWENPFTQETSTAGFWDLYNQAQGAALVAIGNIDKPWFDAATAKRLTQGLDFSGKPTNALDAGKATASNPAKAKRTARTAKAGRDSQVHEGAKTGGDSPTHETAKVGGASPVHEGAKAGKGPQTHKRDR